MKKINQLWDSGDIPRLSHFLQKITKMRQIGNIPIVSRGMKMEKKRKSKLKKIIDFIICIILIIVLYIAYQYYQKNNFNEFIK